MATLMMDLAAMAGFTMVQCVSAPELALLTSQGWRLLALLEGDRMHQLSSEHEAVDISIPGTSANGYQNTYGTMRLPTYRVREAGQFLVGLDKDSALAGMSDDLAKARKAVDDGAAALGLEARAHAETTKKLQREKSQVSDLATALISSQEQTKQKRDLALKLESDIGKIEKEIGGARIREILGR